jgi:hypothetical protein
VGPNAITIIFSTSSLPLWSIGLICQFHDHFSQMVGLGQVISSSQGLYLNTGQHKHRINAHTDIHALCWIRTHDPGFRASEDSAYLRPLGYRDRNELFDNFLMFILFTILTVLCSCSLLFHCTPPHYKYTLTSTFRYHLHYTDSSPPRSDGVTTQERGMLPLAHTDTTQFIHPCLSTNVLYELYFSKRPVHTRENKMFDVSRNEELRGVENSINQRHVLALM